MAADTLTSFCPFDELLPLEEHAPPLSPRRVSAGSSTSTTSTSDISISTNTSATQSSEAPDFASDQWFLECDPLTAQNLALLPTTSSLLWTSEDLIDLQSISGSLPPAEQLLDLLPLETPNTKESFDTQAETSPPPPHLLRPSVNIESDAHTHPTSTFELAVAKGDILGYRFERTEDEGIFKAFTCIVDVCLDRNGKLECWSATAKHRNIKGCKKLAAEACLRLFAPNPDTFQTFVAPALGQKQLSLLRVESYVRVLTNVHKLLVNGDVLPLCIDVEAWEKDGSAITEVGFAMKLPDTDDIWSQHLIITDNIDCTNLRFPNRRHLFSHGESRYSSMASLQQELLDVFALARSYGKPVYLVGCGVRCDITWLAGFGLNEADFAEVVDIGEGMGYMKGSHPQSLEVLLETHGIEEEWLHNGGNDAFATVRLFLAATKRLSQLG